MKITKKTRVRVLNTTLLGMSILSFAWLIITLGVAMGELVAVGHVDDVENFYSDHLIERWLFAVLLWVATTVAYVIHSTMTIWSLTQKDKSAALNDHQPMLKPKHVRDVEEL